MPTPTARPSTALAVLAAGIMGITLAGCGDEETAEHTEAPGPGASPGSTAPPEGAPTTGREPSMTSEPNDSRPAPPPSLPSDPDPGTGPPSPPATDPAVLDEQAKAAVDDLAARLGVDPAAITVRTDERVTWRDGSLGCPEPGRSYTQSLVPGRRLVLVAEGSAHAYHGGRAGELFACATPDPDGTTPGGLLD